MEPQDRPAPGGQTALALLLGINLFNFIDRYVLASVEPEIRAHFFAADDPHAHLLSGSLGSAFLWSYMVSSLIFGWVADRFARWVIIGVGVILWSAATAGCGLALTFAFLFAMRLLVGVGEGAYGPAAPTIIADSFPLSIRGRVMSYFYVAIPFGSAIGYAIGGFVAAHWGWQNAFFVVAPPGILLGIACFFRRDPRMAPHHLQPKRRAVLRDYIELARNPSYVLNTLAMTALTFAIGGMSFWVPGYLQYRGMAPTSRIIFGGILALGGLTATLSGGMAGDYFRKRFAGSYFLVSGVGVMIAFPFSVLMLFTPFPAAWMMMFLAIFFLFFNTGPSNTALANVTRPEVRATAFAVNIFIIHLLGDAPAPPLIGVVADRINLNVAFFVVSAMMCVAGLFWFWGAKFLARDTATIEGVSE
jgi:MFS transporter, Spinster family, sphingosine-1-phosphate transporter